MAIRPQRLFYGFVSWDVRFLFSEGPTLTRVLPA